MKKIKHIEFEGQLDFIRIHPSTYRATKRAFEHTGVIIPSWEELEDIGDRDELWISPHVITVTITFEDTSFYQYKFGRGFIWDKISSPVGRNNDVFAMIPALVHDANFSCKFLGDGNEGFREANKLFYRMCRYFGMNRFRAAFYYLAVNSIVGRAFYAKNKRESWHMKTVEFMESGK